MSTSNEGYYSTKEAPSSNSEYDALVFVIRQVLAGHHHCTLVRVVGKSGDTVDVQPLVNMLDGRNNAIPHGVVNGLRFVRMQGGTNAVILDPHVGDVGLALICDHDTSSAIATQGQANPGSMRRNDLADGVYLGGLLNGEPEQYVAFHDDGIEVVSPKRIKMIAPSVIIDAEALVQMNTPDLSVSGNVRSGGGATGNFSTPQGTVVTVKNGVITNIF